MVYYLNADGEVIDEPTTSSGCGCSCDVAEIIVEEDVYEDEGGSCVWSFLCNNYLTILLLLVVVMLVMWKPKK